jgi:hypothetical protein
MVISFLDSAIPYLERSSEELDRWLEITGVTCFRPVFSEYEPGYAKYIVTYIMYAYSQDSPYLVLGRESAQEKLHIAENIVNMPESLVGDCVKMNSSTVGEVIAAYLDWQGDNDYKRLNYKRDLYEKLSSAMLKDLGGEDGVDVKKMIENDKYLDQLLVDIHEMEERLGQRYKYVNINKEEIEDRRKQVKEVSGNIENSEYIR